MANIDELIMLTEKASRQCRKQQNNNLQLKSNVGAHMKIVSLLAQHSGLSKDNTSLFRQNKKLKLEVWLLHETNTRCQTNLVKQQAERLRDWGWALAKEKCQHKDTKQKLEWSRAEVRSLKRKPSPYWD
eukprot:gnl/TRDRNA2_/TRDRNA2_28169_c0_seq1.p1 gnl/TRDRNA2_/TRDRNA2_28169_c0~~gnl/TRDRNA2_/TRDRNA2_28169_c0_seq1.p1  ORF type:complete len:148 (-),score=37.74 gnl/TRDRNA2_/TRDRNA2_28169_c0_seq1:17-403(-)